MVAGVAAASGEWIAAAADVAAAEQEEEGGEENTQRHAKRDSSGQHDVQAMFGEKNCSELVAVRQNAYHPFLWFCEDKIALPSASGRQRC